VANLNILFSRSSIHHAVSTIAVLLSAKEGLFLVDGFLFLLDEIAESTAAGPEDVGNTITLEVVLGTKLSALHGLWNPMETDAGSGNEEKARSVDWLISFEGAILLVPVVNLAKGDTWAAVGDQAGVNGVAASKEARGPVCGINTALGVDNLAGIAQDVVEAVLPLIDILVVDWALLGWSSWEISLWRHGRVIHWRGHCKCFLLNKRFI